MCMLFICNNCHAEDDEYSLMILSIRDESYDRPTRPVTAWPDSPEIVGAMDMSEGLEGGTWLAVNRETNKIGVILRALRPITRPKTSSHTRGFLVPEFMKSSMSGNEYLESVVPNSDDYPAYNLVTIDLDSSNHNTVSYFSNAETEGPSSSCDPGVYCFANSLPHAPWHKARIGRDQFDTITKRYRKISSRAKLCAALFRMASDDTEYYPDEILDQDGEGYEPEYLQGLSSINCKIPFANFGSRTQTIILVDKFGNVDWVERNLTSDNLHVRGNIDQKWPLRKLRFTMNQEKYPKDTSRRRSSVIRVPARL